MIDFNGGRFRVIAYNGIPVTTTVIPVLSVDCNGSEVVHVIETMHDLALKHIDLERLA